MFTDDGFELRRFFFETNACKDLALIFQRFLILADSNIAPGQLVGGKIFGGYLMDVLAIDVEVVMVSQEFAQFGQGLDALFQLFASHGFQKMQLIEHIFRPFAPIMKQMSILFGVGLFISFPRLAVSESQSVDDGGLRIKGLVAGLTFPECRLCIEALFHGLPVDRFQSGLLDLFQE